MLHEFASTVLQGPNDVFLAIANLILLYILLYGPYVFTMLGIILVIRLFLIKNPSKRSKSAAVLTFTLGMVLTVIALGLHARGIL